MCAKQAGGARSSSGNLNPSLFAALKTVFPYAESLVLNGIGEPLLHPRLENFIKTAKASMPSSRIVTSTPSPAPPACGAWGCSNACGNNEVF